MLQEIKIAQE